MHRTSRDRLHCIMLLLKVMVRYHIRRGDSSCSLADLHEGDTAVALLKAGAETDKKDVDGFLAIDLAPDKQVRKFCMLRLSYTNPVRYGNLYSKVQSEKA